MKYQQSRYSRTTHRQSAAIQPWLWLVLAVLVFVGAGIVITSLQGGGGAGSATGTIKAAQTSFDFGAVPINGGIISTQFPLTMQDDVLVTSLTSTWMCTKARLVQAGHTSDWYGMDHANGPVTAPNIRLAANQPAYLEVTIDPAAHGPNGIGPIQRGVTLKTAGGQELTFDLRAQITK